MSKELITIYKCDRCGKQMDSQYAILTLKHARNIVSSDDLVNKDLCFECFLAIQKCMGNDTEPHGDMDLRSDTKLPSLAVEPNRLNHDDNIPLSLKHYYG